MKADLNATFYKEERFKETPIGKIPEDWKIAKLGELAEYINGYPFSPKDWKKSGLPIIRIQNLNDPHAEFNYFDGEISSRYIVNNGDLLFSWSASIGVYIWNKGKAVLNQHIFKVIPRKFVDKLFLYYAIFLAIEQLRRKVHGSTMKHFRRRELNTTFAPLPPLEEQKAMAYVLSTVDEAIQKTNEIIEKTKRLKKGLIQELLTKGIGHKEFKDTEIGRIPKKWKVVRLRDVALVIMGQSPPSSTYNKEGVGLPFLQGKMEFGNIYPSPAIYCSKPIKIAEANDVLISVRAPVGDVNLAPYRLCIGRGLAAIRFDYKKADYLFYFYYLQRIKAFLETLGKGSTFKAIVKDDLEGLKVPLPPLDEQKKISEILLTADKKLEVERKRKEKLERIKKALMDLLLTGKIRVRVNEN